MNDSSRSGAAPGERRPPRWRGLLRAAVVGTAAAVLLHHALILYRVFRLRETNPDTTAFIKLRNEQAEARGLRPQVRRVWVDYEHISPALVRAVVAAEDPRFYAHAGLDWQALRRSIRAAWEEKRITRGASTISQQLSKNLFLSPSRNPLRKLHESVIAWEMERVLGKRRILELYLNVIEWGDGVYGAEAAARHYFDTPAAALNEEQAAFLAAIIPGPLGPYNPAQHPERVNARRAQILAFIEPEEVSEATLRGLTNGLALPDFPAPPEAGDGEGEIKVWLRVGAGGDVEQLEVVGAPEETVKDALAAALRRWEFRPPVVNGQPVTVEGELTFRYVLRGGRVRLQNP